VNSEQPRTTRRALLKGAAMGAAVCLIGDNPASAAAQAGRGHKLTRTSPEAAGVAPEAVLAFVRAVEQKVGGLHSFMLLRHGQVAAEGWWHPYAPQYPHMLYSLSKSFTSTAVGLAVSEGLLTVDDLVVSFFPDDLPAKLDENLQAMRVRHLLTMSTGHDKDATGPTTQEPSGNWVRGFLALPVQHAPGTKFVYNSAATYMLSAIVQKRTGKTVLEYLKPRLFGPLGVEGPTWESCPRGINTGGWGLSVKTEDIARFGQLYLQKGKWNDRQLIPEKWVDEATTKHISNGTGDTSDWTQGYGYQFWRSRHGAYRGDGAFGQYCVVMPAQDAVLAITSGVGDMQAVLNAAWENLLPGMKASSPGGEAAVELKRVLSGLAVWPPRGRSESPTASRVSGRTYRFEANDQKLASVRFVFGHERCRLTRVAGNAENQIDCGSTGWLRGIAPLSSGPLGGNPRSKIAARGAWADDDTFVIKTCHYETPFVETVTCKFDGDKVTMTSKMNVGFGPTERPPLTGIAT
jgi:CubicO group peptidase (beta-lactamase class C family)